MNKRLLSLAASILLAAAGTFVLLSYVRSADERAAAGEVSVGVLVVDEPIARGTPAEDVANAVRTELVPAKVQAEGSLTTLDGLEGTLAAVDLQPGEQLIASRFVAPEVLAAETRITIPEGLLEVTVALSPERAVGGQPRPGDLVAVLASFDPFDGSVVTGSEDPDLGGDAAPGTPPGVGTESGTEASVRTPNTTHLVLHKVLVTNVQVPPSQGQATTPPPEQGFELDQTPAGNFLVTLALPAPDVERVVFTAEHGYLWLAREPAGAPEDGTAIQTRGSIYR